MDEFNTLKPIYLQLVDKIISQIVRNELKSGDKLLSTRDMAINYSVNPNTVQRTYREMEREGILETKRGQGTFVTEQDDLLIKLRETLKKEQIINFAQHMQEMGYSSDEILSGLQDYLNTVSKGDE